MIFNCGNSRRSLRRLTSSSSAHGAITLMQPRATSAWSAGRPVSALTIDLSVLDRAASTIVRRPIDGRRRDPLPAEQSSRPGLRHRAGQSPDDQAQERFELAARIALGFDRGGQCLGRDQAPLRFLEHRTVQAGHAAEVIDDRGAVDPGPPADALTGGAVKSLLRKYPSGDFDQLRAGALAWPGDAAVCRDAARPTRRRHLPPLG